MIGIDDEKFLRGEVPMTKREIRILTLVNAQIRAEDLIMDVGAGTGSISIEAAKLAAGGHVYAVEKNPDAIGLIKQNAEKFAVKNITIVEATAPDGFEKIPPLDVAIIGGNGGLLMDILNAVDEKLKIGGRIVLNFITVQSLANCLGWLKAHSNYRYDAIQVQINRLQNIGFKDMAKALNPVHIVTAKKVQSAQAAKVIGFDAIKSRIVGKGGLNCV